MKRYKWIWGIFISLAFFLLSIFTVGANNFSEVVFRFNYYLSINKSNPNFFLFSLAGGLFIGATLWFLRDSENEETISQKKWVLISIAKLLVLFIVIFLIIRGIDFFVNRGN